MTIFAQTEEKLFTPINISQVNLTSTEEIRLNHIENNSAFINTQLVSLGNIVDFLTDRVLTFYIPGQELEYTALVNEFEYFSSSEYLWKGNMIDHDGNIALFCRNGGVFGHISIDSIEYSIQTIGDASIFIEYDMDTLRMQKCGNEDEGTNASGSSNIDNYSETSDRETTACTGLVRILVLYTPAADIAANVQDITTAAIEQMNTALSNSDVAYTNVHVSLAKLQSFNFTETPDIEQDVDDLAANLAARILRDQYKADLVIMLTDGNYPGTAGIVKEIGPVNDEAYSIVEVDYATANMTFAHEAAHLFGARHQNDPNGSIQHGYYFTKGIFWWKKYYRTIMGIVDPYNDRSRIQHFSNPDVDYNGKATGTSSSNDNARKLDEEGCTVENFRPYTYPPPIPTVYITGPLTGNNSGTYTWTANGNGGIAPYTYEWFFSLDGTNYYSVGHGPTITAQLPYDNDLYIKVILTDANQEQATDFYYVYNMDAGGGHGATPLGTTDDQQQVSPLIVTSIYPVPANKKVNLQVFSNESSNCSIKITDLMGKEVYFSNTFIDSGYQKLQINTSVLKDGIYILVVEVNNKIETHKIIIRK